MDGEAITLPEHEANSESRAHKLGRKIHELKEEIMSTDNTAAILAAMGNKGDGAGMGLGAGLGGGLLGGILGGVLLNRNGLNGGGVDVAAGGIVTPAMLTSGLASVIDSNQNTTLLQSVGDVKAAVPLAESQVQLALAGVQNDINRAISGSQSDITSILTSNASAAALANQLTNQNIANAIASSLASQGAIKESIAAYGVANLTATKDAQFANQVAISNSTKEILAALNDQNTANLQRQLTVAESVGLENRLLGRQREVEVNVTQTVAQNQAQAQAQQQAQQQTILLSNLCAIVGGLQNAVATNSNLIVGNTGPVGTGSQTANPVNVRT